MMPKAMRTPDQQHAETDDTVTQSGREPRRAPASVAQLFDRFSRDSTVDAGHAAGLGSSIARAYAQAHGGDLLYHPSTAPGARFELVLPRPQ
jgi:K+-sensing histidine kinase KdpD